MGDTLASKQVFKICDVKGGEALFLKVADNIIRGVVFLKAQTKIVLEIVGKHNAIYGKKCNQNYAARLGNADRLVQRAMMIGSAV